MPITLKPNTFLTLEETKDWLRIKPDNTEHDERVKRLINMATDAVEQYIDKPIKTRTFVEYKDGNSSNVIVLAMHPVRSITEIRLDYNRTFDDTTIVSSENYVLRGPPSPDQPYGDVATGIHGEDVVLRDDNSMVILGRIFSGSSVGSIKVTYTAGYGADQDEIPADLVHATLMLVEYFYMLRENRELNLKSKTNTGQSYTRAEGWPKEIREMLDHYVDLGWGAANIPQKNNFSI